MIEDERFVKLKRFSADHIFDDENNQVLVKTASETVAGKIQIATPAEVVTGTDDAKATTAAGVKAAIEAAAPDGSETKITEGTNVTVTGTGTDADPYVINSTGGGGGTVPDASATEAGIVNLTDAQVLGAGSKIIDGVTIGGGDGNGLLIVPSTANTTTPSISIGTNTSVPYWMGGVPPSIVIGNNSGVYAVNLSTHGVVLGHDAMLLEGVGQAPAIAIGPGTKTKPGGVTILSTAEPMDNSIVIGVNATAYDAIDTSGNPRIAIGFGAAATGYESTAFGLNAQATGRYTLALGNAAQATGPYTLALGNAAQATGDYSISIGPGSHSTTGLLGDTTISGIAIGKGAESANGGLAIGQNAYAMNTTAMAIGLNARANSIGTAIGAGAVSDSTGLAIGLSAQSNHNNSNAIGNEAVTTKEYQTVLGNANPASPSKNTEYLMSGSLSFDGSGNGGIVGQVLTSNGNDVSPSWADNVPPIASLTQAGVVDLTNGQVLGNGAKVIDGIRISKTSRGDPANPESAPTTSTPTNISITNDPTTPGQYVGAVGDNNVVIGINANGDFNTVVIGSDSKGIDGAVVVGHQALSTIGASVVIGNEAKSYAGASGNSNHGVVIGNAAKLGRVDGGGAGISSVVIGPAATAAVNSVDGGHSTVIGAGAEAGNTNFGDSTAENSTAIGYVANAKGFNSTALGANSYTTKNNQVVLGNTAIEETVIRGAIAVGGSTVDAGLVGQVLTSAGPDAPAQWADNVPPDASATEAGIVNLVDGQVLGAGSKIIDGVRISRAGGAFAHGILLSQDDAVNPLAFGVGVTGVLGEATVAILGHAAESASHSVVIGSGAAALSTAIVIGHNAQAEGGVVIGASASAIGVGTVNIAIGDNAKVLISPSGLATPCSVAIGTDSSVGGIGATYGDGSVAIGHFTTAGSSSDAVVGGVASTAVGSGAGAGNIGVDGGYAGQATALGYGANAKGQNSTAIGYEAETTKDNQVMLGGSGVTMAETPGRVGSKGHVTDIVLGPAAIDLSQGEYFIVSGSALATTPTNAPRYAFETGGSATFFIVEVSDPTTFTGWWPGIRWENGTPPTLSVVGADLFGFICQNIPPSGSSLSTPFWIGIVLAKALA